MVNDVLFFVGIVKGDRARYPFKLRGRPLVTIPIVVAVLRKTKTAVKQYNDPRISNSKSRPT